MAENQVTTAANTVPSFTVARSVPPKRSVKWVTIYDCGRQDVAKGVVIDPDHMEKLAAWLCVWDLFGNHGTAAEVELDKKTFGGGKFCLRCRDDAAFLLSECPFIDMNRSEEFEIEDLKP